MTAVVLAVECPQCGASWVPRRDPVCERCGLTWDDVEAAHEFLVRLEDGQRVLPPALRGCTCADLDPACRHDRLTLAHGDGDRPLCHDCGADPACPIHGPKED